MNKVRAEKKIKFKINSKKRKFFIIVAILTPVLLIAWQYGFLSNFLQRTGKLEVDFLDIGQGDSTLIKTPGGATILIDGGPDNTVLRRLGDNLPFDHRQIDLMILSHYHEDHATGLVAVVRDYSVKRIIYESGNQATPILETLISAARDRAVPMTILNNQARISLGENCSLFLLNPHTLKIKEDDPNDSLIAKLDCANQKFLFTGDNGVQVEKALINSAWDLRADVLKAAHHGSNSANSLIFLEAVNPRVMVISVGANNKFGHPSPIVVARAVSLHIMVKRTDQDGTVKIKSP